MMGATLRMSLKITINGVSLSKKGKKVKVIEAKKSIKI